MKMTLLSNKLFKRDDNDFVAVNLGNYYLKGLVVKEGKVVDYFAEASQDLPASLKKIWTEKKISTRQVKVSVKQPYCLVRYFPFPKMEKKKLSQTLLYEMNKYVPYSADKVYFDFFILKENSPSENFIIFAVAKKEFINQMMESFDKANLKVSEINLDSICHINIFRHNYEEETEVNACILDIGHTFSTMTVLNKMIPFMTRDIKFSAKEVLQVVSRIKDVSLPEVEAWLLSPEGSSEFLELVSDSISNLCKEVKSSFDYFEVNKGGHIEKLYLTGGLASVKGIEEKFTDFLDIKTSVLKALPKNKIDCRLLENNDKFSFLENSFSASFGLII